jgi:bacterioferritin-associated ferredoxin
MYVCICNCLTERAVREAAASPSVRTADDLFAALDIEPVCGHCIDFADEIIVEASHDNCQDAPGLAEHLLEAAGAR